MFKLSLCELQDSFSAWCIPTDSPGFCDHPEFFEAESEIPNLLNAYAAFVAKRSYSAEYLNHSRAIIEKAATFLHEELIKHGRLGACIDISLILSRILDTHEIWNCNVKGSLTINFPSESRIWPRYFWSCDHGSFSAGHAWLYAPPFTVVDIALRQQPYRRKEREYIPDLVLSEIQDRVSVELEDIASPSAIKEMNHHGIPEDRQLETAAQNIPDIFDSLPPILVSGCNGATLKYSPVAIGATDTPFKEMSNMTFDGLSPWELYTSKIRDQINENA